ncbi:nuclear GTP-binding protein nug1 [Collariella sp. IMI 366227]|nr:nuclear GTP-binding protein nug1 [Collariella sp. IMI 366227]
MAGSINKPKKPKSKRTPTRLRHKIEKASAAKQRKARKLAKKNPEWRSKLKKDPGIPNLFPYKEKLLAQIEEDRTRRKDEAQRRKEAAKAAKTEAAKTGDDDHMDDDGMAEEFDDDMDDDMDEDGSDFDESNPLAALVASARKAAEQYDRELQSAMRELPHGVIEVQGGASSRKAYDKVFKQVVDQADVVLYVLDARDPEGTRSRDVEKAVMGAAGSGKRLILILNKVDLIPPHPPRLARPPAPLLPTLPLRASSPAPNAHTFNHRDITVQSTSSALFRALKSYAASRNLKRAISVGVIGYPNVGKSSVINALLSRLGNNARPRAACPPRTPTSSSSTPSPKQIDDPIPAVTLLLKRLSSTPDLMQRMTAVYDLPPPLQPGQRRRHHRLPHPSRPQARTSGPRGVPNVSAAAMTVVTDWRDGRIQGGRRHRRRRRRECGGG